MTPETHTIAVVFLTCLGFTVFGLIGIVAWFRAKALAEAARVQGRREAFREACAWLLDRGEVAAACAPKGHLTWGMTRAQAFDEAAVEIGRMR